MGPPTILVVDDEPQIRSLLRRVFEREQYRVLDAVDGINALEIWEQYGPGVDLVLTDIVMPRLDGLQLAERISTLRPDVQIVYMSGKCDFETVERQIAEKGFGFIRKPFAIDLLAQKIRQFLGGAPNKKAPGRERSAGSASSAGSGSA